MAAASLAIEGESLDRYRATEERLWREYGLTPSERFVDVEQPHARVRVLEVGPPDAEPILFIGGTGGTGPYWAALVKELAGHRCLLVDRPGWGLSTPIDWRSDRYDRLVSSLLTELMDRLELDAASVAGASIGAVWALRLAHANPARVRRVAILGPGPLVDAVQPPRFIRLLASPLGTVLVRVPQQPGRVRSILEQIGHAPSLDAGRIPDAFIDWRVSFERETGALRHERAMVRAILRGGGWVDGLTFGEDELRTIGTPVLMVYGTSDTVGTIDVWRRFTEVLPNAELHVIDGGGHVPWLDDAAGIGARMRQFL